MATTTNRDGFEFDIHRIDNVSDLHMEVALDCRLWIDWLDGRLPEDPWAFLLARRRAARLLARVLAGVVRDVEELRLAHRCRSDWDRCAVSASDEVLHPVTGDLGDSPWISVIVPTKEAKKWRARLAKDLKAAIADDAAVENVARQIKVDARTRVVTLRAVPSPPGQVGEPTNPHPELAAYRAFRDAAAGS